MNFDSNPDYRRLILADNDTLYERVGQIQQLLQLPLIKRMGAETLEQYSEALQIAYNPIDDSTKVSEFKASSALRALRFFINNSDFYQPVFAEGCERGAETGMKVRFVPSESLRRNDDGRHKKTLHQVFEESGKYYSFGVEVLVTDPQHLNEIQESASYYHSAEDASDLSKRAKILISVMEHHRMAQTKKGISFVMHGSTTEKAMVPTLAAGFSGTYVNDIPKYDYTRVALSNLEDHELEQCTVLGSLVEQITRA